MIQLKLALSNSYSITIIYLLVDDFFLNLFQSKSTIESYTNIYNYIPNRIDPSRFDIRQCYTKDSTFKKLHLAIQTGNCLFLSLTGFQVGPYFPNFPYFLTATLIFLIKASKS